MSAFPTGTRVSWSLCGASWAPPAPGAYVLRDGNLQTERPHGIAPAGATGYHVVGVRVV